MLDDRDDAKHRMRLKVHELFELKLIEGLSRPLNHYLKSMSEGDASINHYLSLLTLTLESFVVDGRGLPVPIHPSLKSEVGPIHLFEFRAQNAPIHLLSLHRTDYVIE